MASWALRHCRLRHPGWLAGWYVTVRPLVSGRNTQHATTKTTLVGEPASRLGHAWIASRTGSSWIPRKKARAAVVSEPNVSFRLCTSRGTSGLELKATVSRWQPVLSHRLLPPRPDNTDSYRLFPRRRFSLWSTSPHHSPGHLTVPTSRTFSHRSTTDSMGSHR